MAVDFFRGQVVQGAMQNLTTGEETQFLFNPTNLSKALAVNYARLQTLGGSHDHLHYKNTGNVQIPLQLYYSLAAYIDLHRGAGAGTLSKAALDQIRIDFEDQRNFYLSLCYPDGRANDPLRRAPPKALLLWPKNVAMEVVVTRYQDSDTLFDMKMNTRVFTVSLQLEEERRWRLTSKKARKIGFKRATGGGAGF